MSDEQFNLTLATLFLNQHALSEYLCQYVDMPAKDKENIDRISHTSYTAYKEFLRAAAEEARKKTTFDKMSKQVWKEPT